jgi:hypothetical protein
MDSNACADMEDAVVNSSGSECDIFPVLLVKQQPLIQADIRITAIITIKQLSEF